MSRWRNTDREKRPPFRRALWRGGAGEPARGGRPAGPAAPGAAVGAAAGRPLKPSGGRFALRAVSLRCGRSVRGGGVPPREKGTQRFPAVRQKCAGGGTGGREPAPGRELQGGGDRAAGPAAPGAAATGGARGFRRSRNGLRPDPPPTETLAKRAPPCYDKGQNH